MAGPTITLHFRADINALRRGVDQVTMLTGGLAAGGIAAAGILAGIPALIGGIGIAAAAQNAEVQASFTAMKDHVWTTLQQLSAPIVPVLLNISEKTRAAFDESTGAIGRMFQTVAPFIDTLATSILSFTTNILPGIEAVLNSSKPVIDAISIGVSEMGTAFSTMFSIISGGAPGAANAIAQVFDIINFLIVALGHAIRFCADWSAILIPLAVGMVAFNVVLRLVQSGIIIYNAALAAGRLALAAWTAAQWLFNAAMAANPIGIVIIAIAALVAAFVWAYNNVTWFRNGVNAAFSFIRNFIATTVSSIQTILGWFGRLPGLFQGWFNGARNAVGAAINGIMGFIGSLPGRILGALGNLGGLLINAGRSLIDGLWRGIQGAFSGLMSGARNLLGGLRNLFPFSPAKEGPFSGRGYTLYSGMALAEDFAKGIKTGTPDIMGAASGAMGAASFGLSSNYNGNFGVGSSNSGNNSGGAVQVTFGGNVDSAFATAFMKLVRTGQIQFST